MTAPGQNSKPACDQATSEVRKAPAPPIIATPAANEKNRAAVANTSLIGLFPKAGVLHLSACQTRGCDAHHRLGNFRETLRGCADLVLARSVRC